MHIQLQLVKVELMLTILFALYLLFESIKSYFSEEKYSKIFFTADEGKVL